MWFIKCIPEMGSWWQLRLVAKWLRQLKQIGTKFSQDMELWIVLTNKRTTPCRCRESLYSTLLMCSVLFVVRTPTLDSFTQRYLLSSIRAMRGFGLSPDWIFEPGDDRSLSGIQPLRLLHGLIHTGYNV